MSVKHFEHCWRWDYLNNRGIIEMVPVSWLLNYKLPNPEYKTTDTHGNTVDLKALKEHILEEGLQHAGVLEVSRCTLNTRIIAGNHRLVVCEELQLAYFPFYVMILDEFYDLEYGIGVYNNKINSQYVLNTKGEVVAPPSKIFPELEGSAFRKKV